MPIQIIQSDERLTYEAEGSKIFYRRISTLRRAAIIKKHTKRGKPNWGKITSDLLIEAITGWEDVQQAGKDIPFSAELITALPEETLTDVLELIGVANPETVEEVPEKN